MTIGKHDEPLRLEWARSLLAVLDAGGFTRAARRLGLSQAAVSTHVGDLERSLGARLLERIGGGVRPTPSGEAVLPELRRLLDGVRAVREAAAESGGALRGRIAVAAGTTPGNYLLPPRIREFEREHPEVRVLLSVAPSAQVLERLASGEADVAFAGAEPPPDRFEARKFADDEIVAFVAPEHRLGVSRGAKGADLDGERLLVREEDSATRRRLDRWLGSRPRAPELVAVGGPESVKRAAAAGLGVGILSRAALEWELEERRLVVLKLPGFPIRRRLWTVLRKGARISRSLQAFLDAVGPIP